MDVFEIEAVARKNHQNGAASGSGSRGIVDEPDHLKPYKDLPKEMRRKEMRKDIHFVEHLWPLEQLSLHFHTDLKKGLTAGQVLAAREKYGENKLTPGKSTPWWLKYLKQYTNFFSLLLLIAAALCFVAYSIDANHNKENLYLGIVLLVVVVVTSTFSYLQESKSAKIMEGFKQLIPVTCHVIRDGHSMNIDASALVPGDLVEMAEGGRVPADIRVVEATDLMVDNSALTGESEPQARGASLPKGEDGKPVDAPALEATNLCFYTTTVTAGSGRGVVIGTGDNTMIGQIAGLTVDTQSAPTPLAIELDQFVKLISLLACIMGLLFFCLGLILGDPIIQNVVFAIGVIVANVPEGLLAAVTVSLALAAKRMHGKNVLVKNLQSVETLGSCTVIASDKTGTLTQNRMTVQHCWYDLRVFSCPFARNRVEWEMLMKGPLAAEAYEPQSPTFQKLQMVATLCNNANFATPNLDLGIEMRRAEFDLLALPCVGDASEQGLLKFVEPIRSAREVRDLYAKLFEIKFNSVNKWQLSIHAQSNQGRLPPVLVMKGAPERVLAKCSYIMVNGQVYDLNKESRQQFQEAYEKLGGFGERVLGFAFRDLDGFTNDFAFSNKPEPNFPSDALTFVGLISLVDPPREGVLEAVQKCKRAAIKVLMVTGDHPITAKAIAKQVGIIDESKLDDGSAAVVTGDVLREWEELDEKTQMSRWDEVLSHDQVVFARVSPAHKLLIVENCQRRKEIVAVTGDGVNDAPALKRADIGVAMGIAGKDVSKEAADMILMDDNFASIVNGVEEGRLIFDNLKKTICYALTVNIPELVPFLLNVLVAVPLPLSTVLMLAICLGTDMVPAISLAYEEKESDIMDRPPRKAATDRLVSGKLVSHAYLQIGVVQALAGLLAYLAVLNDYGYVPWVLPGLGYDFDMKAVICTVDGQNDPIRCGFGCNTPNYHQGLPSSTYGRYCDEGCPIPLPSQPADPFSEMSQTGFRGTDFCALTCSSPPSSFAGGQLPLACQNATLAAQIGFPGRIPVGKLEAPQGGFYWWGGRKQQWPNPTYQSNVLYMAQTAYFVAVVVTQWANLIVCKTRRLSVFKQGMHNHVLNFALLFETGVAALLVYTPFLQEVFSVRPLNFVYWLCGVPFAITILILGEVRKYFIRKYPGGWMDRWTFW